MKAKRAAQYLDMSTTRFLQLVDEGVIGSGLSDGTNTKWDIATLDEYADSLPPRNKASTIRSEPVDL